MTVSRPSVTSAPRSERHGLLQAAAALVLPLGTLTAQTLPAVNVPDTVLALVPSTAPASALKRNAAIEVSLTRAVTPADGVIAICIGPLDLSARTQVLEGTRVRAEPQGEELPVGTHEVVVHLIRNGQWLDVGRFTVTVEGEAGSEPENAGFKPRVTVGSKGTVHERVSGTTPRGARGRFQDLNLTGGLGYEGRPAGVKTTLESNVLGTSHRADAVRFATAGVDAAKLDLNDYKLDFASEGWGATLGHQSFGTHPLLLNAFDSRGLSLRWRLSPQFDVHVGALRATSVVGARDLFGLALQDHRVYTVGVGYEWVPDKPGRLRAELFALDARALPMANVGQGQVPDAEQSRGVGIRLSAAEASGRWKFDALWARSRYVNPADPTLAQGSELVPVRPETRDALQIDASYALIHAAPWLGERLPLTLRALAHAAYSEPLFKSIGSNFIADQALLRYGVEARAGDAQLLVTASRKNDNVKTIPTILKTGTYEYVIQANLPLASLMGTSEKPDPRWPAAQWESRRVRQYTLRVPDGTNARSSFWPDQVNLAHKLALNWSIEPWTVSYTLELGHQDNRQPGRERADFHIQTHGLNVGWRVSETLSVNGGFNRSRNYSHEQSQATYNNGGNVALDWQFTDLWGVKIDFSKAIAYDSLAQQYTNTLTLATQLTRKFTLPLSFRPLPGHVFVRLAHAHNRALDNVVSRVLAGRQTLLQAGLSISF